MIAGLPVDTWLLLIVSVGLPLAIELKFFFTHRKAKQDDNKETEQ